MAATGFTPIQLYRTSTAAATPTAGNLADGELAINLTDEKLYFKNAAGTVKLLAANLNVVANGGTGRTTLTANNVVLGNGASAVNFVAPGTNGNVLTSNGTTWTSAAAPSFSQVYPGAGIAVSTGSAWATSKTTPTGDIVGTSDTQTLTNKTLTSPIITENIQVISTNTTAVRSRTYVFTATLTLTLPASPSAGDWVAFSNRSGTSTPVIGRNGQPIMGLAEDLTVDNVNYFGTLVYADATRGWIFQ